MSLSSLCRVVCDRCHSLRGVLRERIVRKLEKTVALMECPATFVPVEMRQTGMRGTDYGTRKEAYGGADRESAATG
jgi:hypothetical protein